MRTHNGRDFFINKLLYKKSRKNKALILFDYSYYTIIAGVSALVTTQFVSWILGYFK